MNKISCDMCMDLLPLVQDGVASADSKKAVEEHIKTCPQCKKMYLEHPTMVMNDQRVSLKIKSKLHTFFAFLTFLGMFFGISLLLNQCELYVAVIMPIIGICSYVVYHWQALWKSPLILSALFTLAYMIILFQGGTFNLPGLVFVIILIALFTDIGVLIAGLMHFALRKEK